MDFLRREFLANLLATVLSPLVYWGKKLRLLGRPLDVAQAKPESGRLRLLLPFTAVDNFDKLLLTIVRIRRQIADRLETKFEDRHVAVNVNEAQALVIGQYTYKHLVGATDWPLTGRMYWEDVNAFFRSRNTLIMDVGGEPGLYAEPVELVFDVPAEPQLCLIDAYQSLTVEDVRSINAMMLAVLRFRRQYGQLPVELHTSQTRWRQLIKLFGDDIQATGLGNLLFMTATAEELLRGYLESRDMQLVLHADGEPGYDRDYCAAELLMRYVVVPVLPKGNHEPSTVV